MWPPSRGIPCSAGLIVDDMPGAPGLWRLVMIVRREVPAIRQSCFWQANLIVAGERNLLPADLLEGRLQHIARRVNSGMKAEKPDCLHIQTDKGS